MQMIVRRGKSGGSNRHIDSGRAFAIKELLVVAALAGVSGSCLIILNPIDDEWRSIAPERERLMECVVPVGDDFMCLVSVDGFTDPQSGRVSFCQSRLQFARRHPPLESGVLFDVTAVETSKWKASYRCCTWSLAEVDQVQEELERRGVIIDAKPGLRRVAIEVRTVADEIRMASDLPDPLSRYVPSPLQKTGLLVASRRVPLTAIAELKDFPLAQLITAIHTTAIYERWTCDDLGSILPSESGSDLAPDRQKALAHALIMRLGMQITSEPDGVTHQTNCDACGHEAIGNARAVDFPF